MKSEPWGYNDTGNTTKNYAGCGHDTKGEPTKCPACVARLEGANAAKDAALQRLMAQSGHGGDVIQCTCGACKQGRAALFDKGEGG